jgi:hypothetical protein
MESLACFYQGLEVAVIDMWNVVTCSRLHSSNV